MTILAGITIDCKSDGSKAVIRNFSAFDAHDNELTVEDYLSYLSESNVVAHINSSELENSLQYSRESRSTISEVVAACVRMQHELKLCISDNPSSQQIIDFVTNARNVYWQINDRQNDSYHIESVFVYKGQEIFSILYADSTDIFNRKIAAKSIPYEFKSGSNVLFEQTKNGCRFIAEKSGYIAICPEDKLHIVPALTASEDKMRMYLNLLPVHADQDVILIVDSAAQQFTNDIIAEQQCLDLQSLKDKINYFYESASELPVFLTVAEGVKPVDACPCRVNLFVELENKPSDMDSDRVNYADFTSYCMVQQDQKFAEVFKPTPGIPGQDVFGHAIQPSSSDSLHLEIGERIFGQDCGEKTILIATDSGCLIYGDNKISVTDSLIVPGNVGPETGKIAKGPSSVIVQGNIQSGYTVECDDTLIVEGSIEAGARVRCRSLTVYKGIFGHKSDIVVSGDAEIGYIQSASLRVLGNLSVTRYIMESNITCRGNLKIEGCGISGKERGSLIGGQISVLGSASIHSIGSYSEPTSIACGIDSRIHEKLVLCQTAITALNAEAAKIQKTIGFDLSDPEVINTIKEMPESKRNEISEKLIRVRQILGQASEYEQQCDIARQKTFAPDLKAIRINILNHVVPVVRFAIGEVEDTITEKLSQVSVRLTDDELSLSSIR